MPLRGSDSVKEACGSCHEKGPLKSAMGWVSCDKCAKWYHGECQGLVKKEVTKAESLLKSKGFMWLCTPCRMDMLDQSGTSQTTVSQSAPALPQMAELSAQLKAGLAKIEASLDQKLDARLPKQGIPPPPTTVVWCSCSNSAPVPQESDCF